MHWFHAACITPNISEHPDRLCKCQQQGGHMNWEDVWLLRHRLVRLSAVLTAHDGHPILLHHLLLRQSIAWVLAHSLRPCLAADWQRIYMRTTAALHRSKHALSRVVPVLQEWVAVVVSTVPCKVAMTPAWFGACRYPASTHTRPWRMWSWMAALCSPSCTCCCLVCSVHPFEAARH